MKNHILRQSQEGMEQPPNDSFWSPWENMGGRVVLWGKIIIAKWLLG